MPFEGKTVVVGVCGGIAAYKAVEIVSRLRKQKATVHVIMTQHAVEFVTPLTFRELSGQPVVVSMWDEPKNWHVEHIALATAADLFIVAPATANIIGKLASGIADDMLSTTVMATKAPVLLAPAMNTNMYLNPIVQKNLRTLAELGYRILPPACGKLACGTEGPGRLPEPIEVVEAATAVLQEKQSLQGVRVLVTAGGTREPIDPVRYLGNRSSGKMGYAIAAQAARRGAEVILVSGPVALETPAGVTRINVESAAQMREAVLREFPQVQVVVKAAAVADYAVENPAEHKIKKNDEQLTLVLKKNPDILKELGEKKQSQLLVGFAAETRELLAHAREKLEKKNLDLIVANDVTMPGAGFQSDTNIVKILRRDGAMEEWPQLSKEEVAARLWDMLEKMLAETVAFS